MKTSAFSSSADGDGKSLLPIANYRNTRIAATSALLFAVVLGILTSYSAPATADMRRRGSRFQNITSDQITWIGSLPNLGCLFGNILAGYATQQYGRKAVLMLLSLFYVLSWLMIAYAPSIIWIYFGRFIGGLCGGATCVAVPSYIVEIAPTKIRGQLASGFQIAFTFGVLYAMSLGIFLRWSWLAISSAAVVACASCLMLFMPESTSWLVRASRYAEAKKGLKFLRGKHCDMQKELKNIVDNIAEHKEESISIREFQAPELYKPTAIALGLSFFQQACGISPLTAYTVEIFEASHSSIDSSVAAAIVALIQVIATILSGSLMDRSGRRRLFFTSGFFMCISLGALGTYNFLVNRHEIDEGYFGYIPLLSFTVYIFSYSLGNGPIPYVMIPEIVPIRYRTAVVAMAGVFISVLAFVSNKTFENMRQGLGDYGTYWTYGFFSLLSAIFGYFLLPETKGLTISQISRSFSYSER